MLVVTNATTILDLKSGESCEDCDEEHPDPCDCYYV